MNRIPLIFAATLVLAIPVLPQTPDRRVDPTAKQIVDAISEQRMAATLRKLESFGTRYVLSAQDDPAGSAKIRIPY